MSELDLDAAQALADAASPGPWSVEYEVNHWEDFGNTPGEKFPYAIAGPDVMGGGSASQISEIGTADAEFIAQARTLVPALIAALRTQRKVADTFKECLTDTYRPHVTERDMLRKATVHQGNEIERLESELREVREELASWVGSA